MLIDIRGKKAYIRIFRKAFLARELKILRVGLAALLILLGLSLTKSKSLLRVKKIRLVVL